MKLNTKNIRKGLRVELTFRTKRETRIGIVDITWVESLTDKHGTFIYFGWKPVPGAPGSVHLGTFGAAKLRDNPRPFGVTGNVIGDTPPELPYRPVNLFKNPGYDLVNL